MGPTLLAAHFCLHTHADARDRPVKHTSSWYRIVFWRRWPWLHPAHRRARLIRDFRLHRNEGRDGQGGTGGSSRVFTTHRRGHGDEPHLEVRRSRGWHSTFLAADEVKLRRSAPGAW